jgi:hypothetical protein
MFHVWSMTPKAVLYEMDMLADWALRVPALTAWNKNSVYWKVESFHVGAGVLACSRLNSIVIAHTPAGASDEDEAGVSDEDEDETGASEDDEAAVDESDDDEGPEQVTRGARVAGPCVTKPEPVHD